jgi:uncharacterized membrane protein YgdD (TMEM256/DUF423 family)
MDKRFVGLGSVNAFLAVAFGAFGAHALKGKLSSDMLAIFQTGVQYHMIHAIGLICIGIIAGQLGTRANAAGWLLLAGIVLFSGSLYALSLSGVTMLGTITPFGGIAFLAGWIALAAAAFKR